MVPVLALCKIHNFCTTKALECRGTLDPPAPTARDAETINKDGGITLQVVYQPETGQNTTRPTDLLDTGHHRERISHHFQELHERMINIGNDRQLITTGCCSGDLSPSKFATYGGRS
jgi:hypothetical protein